MPNAYTLSPEQAIEWIQRRWRPRMTEVHIVNGLNPNLPLDYYTGLLRAIRQRFPSLHLKAFTAVEVHYFAEKFRLSYREVLRQLIEAGLGSLPGGGGRSSPTGCAARPAAARSTPTAGWTSTAQPTAWA